MAAASHLALGSGAFATDGECLVVCGECASRGLHRGAGGVVTALRGGKLYAARFGIGQGSAALFCRGNLALALAALFGKSGGGAVQFLAPRSQPRPRALSGIERPQGPAFFLCSGRNRAVLRHQCGLKLGQFGGGCTLRRLCRTYGSAQWR